MMEEREQVNSTDMMALDNDTLFAMANKAEQTIEALKKIMMAALKITNELDWSIIGNKPYLEETGCSKVAKLYSVSQQINPNPTIEMDPDGHFTYTFNGEFWMGKSRITAIGSRSSKDEFFAGSASSGKPQKKPQDIDRGDVKKAAYTNCIRNGITRIVPGLRSVKIEDLEAAGLDVSQIGKVGFKGGEQRSEEAKAGVEQVKAYLKVLYGDDAKAQADALEKATTFKGRDGSQVPGRRDPEKLSDKQIEILLPRLKKKVDEQKGKAADAAPTQEAADGQQQFA